VSEGRPVRTARIDVDAGADRGPLPRLWESIGYDEINWTYTPTGRSLLGSFGELTDRGFLVRPHYVFCSGTGLGLPHWGSGNVYHTDTDGNPFYDFTIVDQVYDAIVEAGHHVLVELAFTPRDLLPDKAAELTVPDSPTVYSAYEHGAWAYPPRDYDRWADLVAAHARHCLERYGADEVDTWLWELWNEPDISYWRGTPEQFHALYSVTARAVRSVLPEAKVGGPAVTGGGDAFLRGFLAHTLAQGDPLDFVSFHTKGLIPDPWRVYGPTGGPSPKRQSPSLRKMIFEIRRHLRVIAEFEPYRRLPAIVDECDAAVPAHFGVFDNADYGFQNTAYYPVFQVKLMKKLLDLNDVEEVQVERATSWSFYFEGERCFEGTRAFLTAGGVEKPLLNAYRLLARLGPQRVAATSDAAWPLADLDAVGETIGLPEEVDVLATRDDAGGVTVAVWRHADDQYRADDTAACVDVVVHGLVDGPYLVRHLRIDAEHSNAHAVWRSLGAPDYPDAEQFEALRARQGLEELALARRVAAASGGLDIVIDLPLPAVSLLIIQPFTAHTVG